MGPLKPLQIDIVSDVVCPWCYIGKRLALRAYEMQFCASMRTPSGGLNQAYDQLSHLVAPIA